MANQENSNFHNRSLQNRKFLIQIDSQNCPGNTESKPRKWGEQTKATQLGLQPKPCHRMTDAYSVTTIAWCYMACPLRVLLLAPMSLEARVLSLASKFHTASENSPIVIATKMSTEFRFSTLIVLRSELGSLSAWSTQLGIMKIPKAENLPNI